MDLEGSRILIVDDEKSNLVLLRGMLQREGYRELELVEDSREAIETFKSFQPDLLVLDLHMPHMSGFEVMAGVRELLDDDAYFPILMLTADVRPEVKEEALAGGARDFLTKPLNSGEVRLRIRNLLEARHFHLQVLAHNDQLEERVRQRTRQLEEAQLETLVRLAKAAEYRDDDSGEHVWRVAQTSMLLARELGLPLEQCELILRAARLHDIGKIGVPDGILYKPANLTPEEFALVKTHTTLGAELLSGGRSPLMKMAELIALTHHEQFDGGGYPRGLAGDEIPIEGRIMAVADAFDALTHDRPHQRACTDGEALAEIEAQAGRQFDPQIVEAFVRLYLSGELTFGPLAA